MSADHQNTDRDTIGGSKSQQSQSKKRQEKVPKGGSSKKMTDDEQSARFIETARELQVDESGEAFISLMEKISRSKRST